VGGHVAEPATSSRRSTVVVLVVGVGEGRCARVEAVVEVRVGVLQNGVARVLHLFD